MRLTRRRAITSGVALGTVGLAGCSGDGTDGGDGSDGGDGTDGGGGGGDGGTTEESIETLDVANIEGATLAPFMVSQERGLFEERGIEIEAQTFVNPSDMYNAVQIGELDFAYATSPFPVARGYNAGQEISLLKPDMASNFFMVGKAEYDSIADLRGERVGNLPPGSSTHFGWSVAIDAMFDESFSDFFEIVAMGPSSMAASIQNGEIEAATLWPPFTVELMASDDYHIIAPLEDVYKEGTGHNPRFAVGAARNPYLSEKGEAIQSFYDAIAEAAGMIEDNPDIMVDVGYVDIFGLETDRQIELLKQELSGMYPTEYDQASFRSDLSFQFEEGVARDQLDEVPGDDIYDFI